MPGRWPPARLTSGVPCDPAPQRLTRHNDYYGTSGGSADPSNPWGNRAAGGASARRALQRLGERYGIRHWG